jgi:hypothetical protein
MKCIFCHRSLTRSVTYKLSRWASVVRLKGSVFRAAAAHHCPRMALTELRS